MLEVSCTFGYNAVVPLLDKQYEKDEKTMSSSIEKKERKQAAQAEQQKKSKRFKRRATISVIVIVIVLALSIFVDSTYLYTKTTAVQIGDTGYSAAEFDYFYRTAYASFYRQYQSYISYFIDSSKSLTKQKCSFSSDENATWADYFTESAISDMQRITALCDQAAAEGFELTDDGKTEIESSISDIEASAASSGYKNPDKYLGMTIGKGMTLDLYRELVTKFYTARDYAQHQIDSYSYTDEELKTYYAENKDAFDIITYNAYLVGTSLDRYSDFGDEAKVTAAHNDAETIASATTQEEFADKVLSMLDDSAKEGYTGVDYTLNTYSGDYLAKYVSSYSEWLLNDDRVEGDTTIIDTDNGSYAVMFISRDDNNYATKNTRHILINAEADENGEFTDEALQAAKDKAEEILAEWKADPTEDHFAELANEYSEDSGSNTDGGLYVNVSKNQFVTEYNDFLYNEDHKPGDTAIVYGTNGSYAGYHIVYFVGNGVNYAEYLADNGKRTDDYNQFESDLIASYPASTKFCFKFAELD